MKLKEELTDCLRLQRELEAKQKELALRFKAILETEEAKQKRIIVEIDGDFYELKPSDETAAAMESARKLGGFYGRYRLVSMGKPI